MQGYGFYVFATNTFCIFVFLFVKKIIKCYTGRVLYIRERHKMYFKGNEKYNINKAIRGVLFERNKKKRNRLYAVCGR